MHRIVVLLFSLLFHGFGVAALPDSGVEVVPLSQFNNDVGNFHEKAWISESQGLAVTGAVFDPGPFRTSGGLHVWSLRTGHVLHTIDTPARAQVIAGDGRGPIVFVAGGPTQDAAFSGDKEFVWMLDLQTGRRVRELPLWSRSAEGVLEGGGLSRDRTKLVLTFNTGNCAVYDLAAPGQPRIFSEDARTGDLLVAAEEEFLRSVPNWLDECGAMDGVLRLGRIKNHRAIWRADTGEELMPLGFSGREVDCWVPSADGNVLLGIRRTEPNEKTPHLVIDLKRWTVTEWLEPQLAERFQPALTRDGSIVRFGRVASGGRMEFVSRDWRANVERVDYSTILAKQDRFWQKEAAFSSDGMALAITHAQGSAILRWNESDLSPPRKIESKRRIDHVAGISGDGSTVYHLNPTGNLPRPFKIHTWEVGTGREVVVAECVSTDSMPQVILQSLPGISSEVLSGRGDGEVFLQTRTRAHGVWQQQLEAKFQETKGLRSGAIVRLTSGDSMLVQFYDSAISTHDAASGRKLAEFRSEKLWSDYRAQERVAAPLAGRIFAGLDHGGVQILDVEPGGALKEVAQFWSPAPGSWLAVLPDGRYAASPGVNPPVFIRHAGRLYPFEEFDAELNQPDAVAAALGVAPSVVAELRTQREKRLTRLRLPGEPPKIENRPSLTLKIVPPLIHDQPTLVVEGVVQAAEAPIVALALDVNDVPVFGASGQPLAAAARTTNSFRFEVPLAPGANKVQLAARDSAGGVSLRETFRVHRSARDAAPTRFVLAIGVSDYDDDRLDLQYAGKDAQDLARALITLNGRFANTHSLVLTDKKARRAGILAAKEFLRQTRPEDEVIVFVSGHGGVSAQGDYFFCAADFRPDDQANGVSFADLEGLFDGVPALTRLLLVDSCHSGELTDEQVREASTRFSETLGTRGVRVRSAGSALAPGAKGAAAGGAAREMFLDLRRTTGATVLAASGGLEFAMESADAKNGLFTHSFLAALAAAATDVNHDGEVTASELIQATASSVEELTGGLQRPNARFTNRAFDFPITSRNQARNPGKPEDVVRNFVEWSSFVWHEGLHPRLRTCFEPTFRYFGEAKSFASIEADPRTFKARFPPGVPTRIKSLGSDSDGRTTVRCDVSFRTPSLGRLVPARAGEFTVEAILRPVEHEWKIVSLRTLASPRTRDGDPRENTGRAMEQPPATPLPENNSASVWVFPASSERLLDAAEIVRLTAHERWRARNEIYARHGLIFSSPKGKAFARSLGGAYREVAKDVSVIERGFNHFERANVLLIKTFETSP